jgi:hypothetical protein
VGFRAVIVTASRAGSEVLRISFLPGGRARDSLIT